MSTGLFCYINQPLLLCKQASFDTYAYLWPTEGALGSEVKAQLVLVTERAFLVHFAAQHLREHIL